jgi:hypothetical protein
MTLLSNVFCSFTLKEYPLEFKAVARIATKGKHPNVAIALVPGDEHFPPGHLCIE